MQQRVNILDEWKNVSKNEWKMILNDKVGRFLMPQAWEKTVHATALKQVTKTCRQVTSCLKTQYMDKDMEQMEKYPCFKPEVWEQFKAIRLMPEWSKKSQQYSALTKRNIHPHRPGTSSTTLIGENGDCRTKRQSDMA